ncbi:MAG: hypothetical protein U9R15_07880 [Chloroflexota bacterium]|nr:hypothetical protein [Chloroflexota bacterium]
MALQESNMDWNKPTMPLTITTFPDLLQIVNTYPEWRHKMIKALFPEIDVPKSFQRLTAIIERLDRQMGISSAETTAERKSLEERVETGFAEATAARETGFAEAAVERKSLEKRMETGFAEAAAARETGFAEAAAARETGFAEAAAERKSLEKRMETGFAEAAADRKEIKGDLANLKGQGHEMFYRRRADSIFGLYVKRGRDVTSSVGEQLYNAVNAGTILEQERVNVLASDLLWGGRLYETGEEVILVVEASWLGEETDVERAAERASILRKIGLRAVPVVAAKEWAAGIPEMAYDHRVAMTINGCIDKDSWQAAVDKRHPEEKQREWDERQVDEGD